MLFSSPIFLFLFLPLVLFIYWITPKKFKNLCLFTFSIAFYTWGEQELVILILLSTLIDYSCGLIISSGKKKLGLFISIFFNLSILIYFKYSGFIFSNLVDFLQNFNISFINASKVTNVALPLGISFYTFQTMSYTIDVYRGNVKATKDFITFGTYVTLFPQLIAGPIVRYTEIEKELKNRTQNLSQFSIGIERFIIGLAKKVIIANNCAVLADAVFAMPTNEMSATIAWLGVLIYGLQIYFDFSGYSDMAIGLGKMFGFNIPENFNFPYIATSVREFWKRWHITLSRWFKDYLYISLGGNRKSNIITYFNLFIVFVVTGFWHGADWTFIIWGIFHGIFIILEKIGLQKILQKLPKIISHIYLLLVVNIAWVFFRSSSLEYALSYIRAMFSFTYSTNIEFLNYYYSTELIIVIVIAIMLSIPIFKNSLLSMSWYKIDTFNYIKIISLVLLFIICCVYISVEAYNPFIYFRF
jgi:alginate O-acetyltransferase complex protein AlgI